MTIIIQIGIIIASLMMHLIEIMYILVYVYVSISRNRELGFGKNSNHPDKKPLKISLIIRVKYRRLLLNPDREASRCDAPVASISARVWNVACHRRNDVATDLMHDAIMIMHSKKYDKLGVARPTTIIFHPVDRLTGRSPG